MTGETVREHLGSFFAGHQLEDHRWLLGPMADEHPRFYVCEIAPGPRSALWLYASIGASDLRREKEGSLEFILACPSRHDRGVELITMVARYHRSHSLGKWHTFALGEPWWPGATCDHMLVSQPYLWGPTLEVVSDGNEHVHIFWLLPITASERAYKVERGAEALEAVFEEKGLEYWKVDRPSLV